jgi:predicted alpha/beta-fold hydrolase
MIENADKRGVLGMIYEVRICCGKSERAPRFYFMR